MKKKMLMSALCAISRSGKKVLKYFSQSVDAGIAKSVFIAW